MHIYSFSFIYLFLFLILILILSCFLFIYFIYFFSCFILFYVILLFFLLHFILFYFIFFNFNFHFIFIFTPFCFSALKKNIWNKKIIMRVIWLDSAMQNMARFIRYMVLGGFWTEKEERLGIGVSLWQQSGDAVWA